MKKNVFLSLILIAVFACCSVISVNNVFVAKAGSSMANVASVASVVDGRINTGDFMISGGVRAEGSTVIFDENCASSSKLLGKTKIKNLSEFGISNLLIGKMKFKIANIVENGAFSICFGLDTLSSKKDAKGVVEIKFAYDNGINMEIAEHLGNNVENVLLSLRQYAFMQNGETISIGFNVFTDGGFVFSLNGTEIVRAGLYEGGDGYFAVFSEGKNTVYITEMAINGYSYDLPQNVEYTETFDNDSYNANVFYSESSVAPVSPSYLTAENGELVFSNTAGAHITTKYNYSNFELEFDITDIQRVAEYDEKGNVKKLISNWFTIAFGVDSCYQLAESTFTYATSLQVEGMPSDGRTDQTVPYSNPRLVLYDKGKAEDIVPMPINIWSKEHSGKVVNIKFNVSDGVIKLWMKFAGESYGEPCYVYDLGFTPYGCVRIFTWGQNEVVSKGIIYNSIANFKIDNLTIKNTDYDGVKKIVSVEYSSNYIAPTPDYDYSTELEDGDMLINRIDEFKGGQGCGSAVAPVYGVFVLLLAAAAFIIRRIKDE